jgi:hypothetical protein
MKISSFQKSGKLGNSAAVGLMTDSIYLSCFLVGDNTNKGENIYSGLYYVDEASYGVYMSHKHY